jgi:hypothetical protein
LGQLVLHPLPHHHALLTWLGWLQKVCDLEEVGMRLAQ